jgi:hypothetical protein
MGKAEGVPITSMSKRFKRNLAHQKKTPGPGPGILDVL